jgi:hypothetical protein
MPSGGTLMVNTPSPGNPSTPREEEPKPGECPPDNKLPENSQENLDARLDHAIEETFPTSDPISVTITKGAGTDPHSQSASPASALEPQTVPEQDTAEALLEQVRETLNDVAGVASETAHDMYSKGRRYVRRAGDRYPAAEQYYQSSSRALNQHIIENPMLSLLVAGAVGYGLAWMIHGSWRARTARVPDYARTQGSYAPHRDEPWSS